MWNFDEDNLTIFKDDEVIANVANKKIGERIVLLHNTFLEVQNGDDPIVLTDLVQSLPVMR